MSRTRSSSAASPPSRILLAAASLGGSAASCWPSASAATSLGSTTRPTIARHPQYQITAENIHITPPPPWIRSDIKAEVLRDAGLVGNALGARRLGQRLPQRVRDAFEFHPWVASVERITKRLPSVARHRARLSPADRGGRIGRSRTASRFLPIDEHASPPAGRRFHATSSAATCRGSPASPAGRSWAMRWDDPRVDRRRRSWPRRSPTCGSSCGSWRSSPSLQPQVRGDAQHLRVRDHHQRRHADRLGRRTGQEAGRRRIAVRRKSASGCWNTPPSTASSIRSTARPRSTSAAIWSSRRAPRDARRHRCRSDANEIAVRCDRLRRAGELLRTNAPAYPILTRLTLPGCHSSAAVSARVAAPPNSSSSSSRTTASSGGASTPIRTPPWPILTTVTAILSPIRIRSPIFRLRTSTSLASPLVRWCRTIKLSNSATNESQASQCAENIAFARSLMCQAAANCEAARTHAPTAAALRTRHSPPRRPHRARTGALFGQQLLQRGEQSSTFALPAGVAHQPDPPDLAFERAEPGADLDAEPLEQRLAHGHVIDARRESAPR